jgi:hypothetical protein
MEKTTSWREGRIGGAGGSSDRTRGCRWNGEVSGEDKVVPLF